MERILLGVAAGAIATWIMGPVTSFLYARESAVARRQEDEARGGLTAYAVAARKLAKIVGSTLTKKRAEGLGSIIHWALGIGAGIVFLLVGAVLPGPVLVRGLLFGLLFWIVIDEGANWLLRLTPGPTAFPWQAHARGLAGHLVFGVTAALTVLGYGAIREVL